MPKYQNRDTHSIVDIDEDTAATLGREWAPLGATDAKAADGTSTQAQQRKLSELLKAAGLTDRAAKFGHLSERLDREVGTWKDVTADEADELIVELEASAGKE